MIQQLRRAHSTFLLHHDFTLDGLYQRVGRPTFCLLLERFWTKFAWSWDVLLSGNPSVDIYNGIKLSVGGELGIGVGEEEWGSGERAVLEDFVGRTDGLVDLVVSRFGDPPATLENTETPKKPEGITSEGKGKPRWLGSERCPRPYDGVIFSGMGAISRTSLAQVSQWMEWIYRYGDEAYGVGDDPTSMRRRKNRKRRTRPHTEENAALPSTNSLEHPTQGQPFSPGIPKPLVKATGRPPPNTGDQSSAQISGESSPARNAQGSDWTGLGTDTFMKLLTLGYGSSWSLPSRASSTQPSDSPLKQEDSSNNVEQNYSPDARQTHEENSSRNHDDTKSKIQPPGRFLIGLRDGLQSISEQSPENRTSVGCSDEPQNSGILHRTVHIQLASPAPNEPGLIPLPY